MVHSGRKTSITRSLYVGVPLNTMVQLSGHKNTSSMTRYAVASDDRRKQMSEILEDCRSQYDYELHTVYTVYDGSRCLACSSRHRTFSL